MKSSPPLGIALTGLVLFGTLLHAQDPVPPWKAGPVNISRNPGCSTARTSIIRDPASTSSTISITGPSDLGLNMAKVGLSHDPDPFGFEIDFGAGDTY